MTQTKPPPTRRALEVERAELVRIRDYELHGNVERVARSRFALDASIERLDLLLSLSDYTANREAWNIGSRQHEISAWGIIAKLINRTMISIVQMKTDAKRALKALRSGDVSLIAEVRAAYPELCAGMPDDGVIEGMTLMNIQHVIARRNGFVSWHDALEAVAAEERRA